MKLTPAMSYDQAREWLHRAVALCWDEPAAVTAGPVIDRIAAAMAAIAATELPLEVEPVPLSLLTPETLAALDV